MLVFSHRKQPLKGTQKASHPYRHYFKMNQIPHTALISQSMDHLQPQSHLSTSRTRLEARRRTLPLLTVSRKLSHMLMMMLTLTYQLSLKMRCKTQLRRLPHHQRELDNHSILHTKYRHIPRGRPHNPPRPKTARRFFRRSNSPVKAMVSLLPRLTFIADSRLSQQILPLRRLHVLTSHLDSLRNVLLARR